MRTYRISDGSHAARARTAKSTGAEHGSHTTVGAVDVLCFDDPEEFADRVRPVLLAHRTATNVIAVRLQDILAGQPLPPTRWFLIENDGEAVGTAMLTVGFNLMLSPLPAKYRDQAAARLAGVLMARGEGLPGATGEPADVNALARAWAERGGGAARRVMHELLYEIRHAPEGPRVPGFGRPFESEDGAVLHPYLTEFYLETFHEFTEVAAQDAAAKRLTRQGVMVWECDGEIVSLAGLNGPAAGVARLGPVFTPPKFRRRGFGGAVTAYATRAGFKRGAEYCMLFADRDNPVSNSAYSRLGFEVVGLNIMVAFEPFTV